MEVLMDMLKVIAHSMNVVFFIEFGVGVWCYGEA